MPFVSIKFVRENIVADPEGKKARIADRVAQAVSDEMGVAKHDVWVAFEDIAARDFYLGGDSVEAISGQEEVAVAAFTPIISRHGRPSSPRCPIASSCR